MAKFVTFMRDAERQIKIDVEKVVAYEPSGSRQYPEDEYTCINLGAGIIYVNEPFEAVDRKIDRACSPFDPNKRI